MTSTRQRAALQSQIWKIADYAANAGKSGSEFFTPQHVSNSSRNWLCTSRQVSTRFTTRRAVLGLFYCKPKKHVDIAKLNAELKSTAARIDALSAQIDAIVADLETV